MSLISIIHSFTCSMKTDNIIQQKSYAFALGIIGLRRQLFNQREYDLARQLLKSGTSIGANVEEAIGAQSTKDFLSKLSIAYKECRETHYWLRLIRDAGILPEHSVAAHIQSVDELQRIIGSIQKSTKARLAQ